MKASTNHLSRETLGRFLNETLLPNEALSVESHLAEPCEVCQNALAQLAGVADDSETPERFDEQQAARGLAELKQRLEESEWPQENAVTQTRFQRIRKHAQGGISVVFVYKDQSLGREVAVKCLQSRVRRDPAACQRFDREYAVTSALDHPGVPPVYCAGRFRDGRRYFAMRFVGGQTLAKSIREFHNGTSPQISRNDAEFRALLDSLKTICETVGHAHERQVCHCDLKPGNVHVYDKETVVLDWGLAERLEGRTVVQPPWEASAPDQTSRGRRSAPGTPEYMSPEQAQGRMSEIGVATDVYGLGAILFEILTSSPPHPRPSQEHVDQRPASAALWPDPRSRGKLDVPAELASVCRKAMAPLPEDRYTSAHEVSDALDQWLTLGWVPGHQYSVLSRILRWMQRHIAVAGTALAGAAVVLIVALTAAWSINAAHVAEQRAHRQTDRLLRGRQTAAGVDEWNEGRLMRSLPWFALSLSQSEPGTPEAVANRVRLATTLARCPDLRQCWFERRSIQRVALSDRSRRVMIQTDEDVQVRDILSGRQVGRTIRTEGQLKHAVLSASGDYVLTQEAGPAFRLWDATAGSLRSQLAPMERGFDTCPMLFAQFDADDSHVLVVQFDSGIHLWEVATGEAVPLQTAAPNLANIIDPMIQWNQDKKLPVVLDALFDPEGERLIAIGQRGGLAEWSVQTGELTRAVALGDRAAAGDVAGKAARIRVDGRMAMFVQNDGMAQLYDLRAAEAVGGPMNLMSGNLGADGGLEGNAQSLEKLDVSVAFDSDGRQLAIRMSPPPGYGTMWDSSSVYVLDYGNEVADPTIWHERVSGVVRSADFVRNGQSLMIVNETQQVLLWDVGDASSSPAALQHVERVVQAAERGDYVVTLSGNAVHEMDAAPAPLPAGEDSNAQSLPPIANEMEIRVWQWSPGALREHEWPIAAQYESVRFSPDSKYMAAMDTDHRLHVLSVADGQSRRLHQLGDLAVDNYAFSRTTDDIVVFFKDGTARGWSVRTGEPSLGPIQASAPIMEGALDVERQLLVGIVQDGTARLWDLSRNTEVKEFARQGSQVGFLGGDEPLPAVINGEALWIWENGRFRALRLSDWPNPLLATAVDQPLACVVTQRDSEGLQPKNASVARIFNTQTGATVRSEMRHGFAINAVDFSPGGRLLATASDDGTARVWTSESGAAAGPPLVHATAVVSVHFSADGTQLLTIAADDSLRLWDVQTGQQLAAAIFPGSSWVHQAALADGEVLVAASPPDPFDALPNPPEIYTQAPAPLRLLRWDVTPSTRSTGELQEISGILAGHEIDSTGGFVPIPFKQREREWRQFTRANADARSFGR